MNKCHTLIGFLMLLLMAPSVFGAKYVSTSIETTVMRSEEPQQAPPVKLIPFKAAPTVFRSSIPTVSISSPNVICQNGRCFQVQQPRVVQSSVSYSSSPVSVTYGTPVVMQAEEVIFDDTTQIDSEVPIDTDVQPIVQRQRVFTRTRTRQGLFARMRESRQCNCGCGNCNCNSRGLFRRRR